MHPNEPEPSKGMSSPVESTAPYQITLTMYPDGKVAVSDPQEVEDMEEMEPQESKDAGSKEKMDMSKKGHMGGDAMMGNMTTYGKKFASMDKAMKYMMSVDTGDNKAQESMMHQGFSKSMGSSEKMDKDDEGDYA
jgi:hypothetical protein